MHPRISAGALVILKVTRKLAQREACPSDRTEELFLNIAKSSAGPMFGLPRHTHTGVCSTACVSDAIM